MTGEKDSLKTKIKNNLHYKLWQRIENHNFEPDTPLNFTVRLARDMRWSIHQTRLAIDAYKKFCFLAIISDTVMTPSDTVDEVWHQHMIYTRDYWDIWCRQVLGAPLHHDPTPGGSKAQQYYKECYANTLALYEQYFGCPDPVLWPATYVRFGRKPRYRLIDTSLLITLPNPLFYIKKIIKRRAGCL